jgi:hypothetical protein
LVTKEYRTNRAQFPQAELTRYQGNWVAFSVDGCRILASGDTLERLESQIAAAGEDPLRLVLEWIAGSEDDSLLGGGELL